MFSYPIDTNLLTLNKLIFKECQWLYNNTYLLISGNLAQLGVLSLRDNKLSYLPSEIGNCKELHVLDVSGNR